MTKLPMVRVVFNQWLDDAECQAACKKIKGIEGVADITAFNEKSRQVHVVFSGNTDAVYRGIQATGAVLLIDKGSNF